MRIIIDPLDVLMFRSSRPFYRGENFIAEGGYITPLTFAGALRSELLLRFNSNPPKEWWKNDEFKEIAEEIGSPENEGTMQVLGAFFAYKDTNEELFPLPLDVVQQEDEEKREFDLLKPKENELLKLGSCYPLVADGSYYVKALGGFLPREEFLRYLDGEIPNNRTPTKEIYGYERRFGIGLEKDKKLTEESMLYVAEFLRVENNIGFTVWLKKGESFPPDGLVRLGGEGRAAHYKKIDDYSFDLTETIKKLNDEKTLKIYLATPAVFEKDTGINWWMPDIANLEHKLNIHLELIASSVGKPIHLGGWDAAKGKQKPLRSAVRAGSVYFFKKKGRIVEDIEIPFSISSHNARQGLGTAFIGRC